MNDILTNVNESIRMKVFSFIKTNNPVLDTVITTILLTLMSYVVKRLYDFKFSLDFDLNIIENTKFLLYRKNTIIMEGKKCSGISNYNSHPIISSVFGNRFKAIWSEIIAGINVNDTIYEIKDFYSKEFDGDCDKQSNDVFIVSQKKPFLFNKELKIYALTQVTISESNSEKKDSTTKTENIEITLYSYTTPLIKIKDYIDHITDNYIQYIEKSRNNKLFFYTLIKTKHDESVFECWNESIFNTSRSFKNMFFHDKSHALYKLDFFLNNKEWFYRKGIPYSLGFALYGPPGTGKTSFIKCLAQYTNRHIIRLSLKLIKTQQQLRSFFFEDRYNYNNKKHSIGFANKIIVIEDIDAQDIVWEREKDTKKEPILSSLRNIYENEKNKDNSKMLTTVITQIEDPITLDDILNLWDGIEETPGRIMVITTNHYDKIDEALKRPGRIDMSINMGNCSHQMIIDLYNHLYEREPDLKKIKKIKHLFYSPAEITNCYLSHKDDCEKFMEVLMKNKKLK